MSSCWFCKFLSADQVFKHLVSHQTRSKKNQLLLYFRWSSFSIFYSTVYVRVPQLFCIHPRACISFERCNSKCPRPMCTRTKIPFRICPVDDVSLNDVFWSRWLYLYMRDWIYTRRDNRKGAQWRHGAAVTERSVIARGRACIRLRRNARICCPSIFGRGHIDQGSSSWLQLNNVWFCSFT